MTGYPIKAYCDDIINTGLLLIKLHSSCYVDANAVAKIKTKKHSREYHYWFCFFTASLDLWILLIIITFFYLWTKISMLCIFVKIDVLPAFAMTNSCLIYLHMYDRHMYCTNVTIQLSFFLKVLVEKMWLSTC